MKYRCTFSKMYLDILIANSIPGSEQYLMLMAIKNEMEENGYVS